MVDYKDHYQTLSVDRSVKQGDIKRAYPKLVRQYHPDVSKEVDAEEKFKEFNAEKTYLPLIVNS